MNNLILVGSPNVGKTTLFNTLTGKNEKASNWHGVTVKTKSANYSFGGETFSVVDLPGLYSLQGGGEEERIASDYLLKNTGDLVINVCDANNIKANIKLTKELLELGLKVILAVNMSNENKMKNEESLSSILGVPVVLIDARKSKSVGALKQKVSEVLKNNFQFKNAKNNKYLQNSCILDNFFENNLKKEPYKVSDKIDKIILNKYLFLPIFFCVIFLVFYLTFSTIGELVSSVFGVCFSAVQNFLSNFIYSMNMSFVLQNFLVEAVINSFFSVLSFVPQIILLMFFVGLLEDTGYMSRVAFMFDGLLKKIGLSGKSIFSLMMGYGCTTGAIYTTRNLENKTQKKRTALLLPFSTCSAKLPVFLVISSLFFDNYKYLFVFGLYLVSILVMIISALIFKKFTAQEDGELVLELPKYRLPYFKKILKDASRVLAEFLIKVGTLIIFFGGLIWLLQNFSVNFEYLQSGDFDKSILYFLCSKIAILFKPIGLGSAGIVATLIFGLVAKELVVVGLGLINGVQGTGVALSASLLSASSVCYFTRTSSIVFLLFVLLYSPCISALGAIRSEFGTKTSVFVFLYQFFISYAVCFAVFQSMSNINFCYFILALTLLVIILHFVLKWVHKKSPCGGNCVSCHKVCGHKR